MNRGTAELPAAGAAAPRESYRAGALVILLRLHWFIRLRWVFFGGALAVLALERFLYPEARRPWPLLATVLAVGLVNLIWTISSRQHRRRIDAEPSGPVAERSGQIFANAQVATDLVLLTAILHYTGGVENPMSAFYVFHVAIGGLLLGARQASLQSGLAVVLYGGMLLAELAGWLPHYPLLPQLGATGLHRDATYALLFWLVEACAVFGILYFTLRIARLLDRHEAQLQQANAALQQSQQAIQDLQRRRARFMQTAAHQLKAPLAIAQTLANLIRDRIVMDEAGIQATCDKIARRCQEGIEQVGELLTLARVQDADPARHYRSRADAAAIVRELAQHFRPLADRERIEVTCWTPPEDAHVRVDPQDLRTCVGNLIENALKYTPGPGRVRVAVTVKQERGRPVSVGIHVSDTGIGFDPQLLRSAGRQLGEEPVFDAFRRGPNAILAGIPGTGLGLSIVREIVEQAGGRIWVMSRPGAGSSFTLTLPPDTAEAAEPRIRNTRGTQLVFPENPAPRDG